MSHILAILLHMQVLHQHYAYIGKSFVNVDELYFVCLNS
jgi:hypothetical protein